MDCQVMLIARTAGSDHTLWGVEFPGMGKGIFPADSCRKRLVPDEAMRWDLNKR